MQNNTENLSADRDSENSTLLEFLSQFVSDHKKKRMQEVMTYRTRQITIALEDIYQSQNASATMRTCECLGIQDVHIIESRNVYTLNPDVVMGANKWLDFHYYGDQSQANASNNSQSCIQALRSRGYQIVATSPHQESHTPDTLPLELPVALFFGTEETGLSKTVLEQADMHLRLPMFGFTESYNISVSVALVLQTLVERLHKSDIAWQLTPGECQQLLLTWYRQVVRRHEDLEEEFQARKLSMQDRSDQAET